MPRDDYRSGVGVFFLFFGFFCVAEPRMKIRLHEVTRRRGLSSSPHGAVVTDAPAAFPLSVPCVFGSVGARAVRMSEKVFQDSTVPWLLG